MSAELKKQQKRVLLRKVTESGFSVVEIILASAIFMIFSSGAIFVVLQSFDANRLGAEEASATQFASEGIEAVRSIRNQSFANLVNSTGTGITRNGSGVWTFGGVNNTFNKYTRIITVSSVQRDGSGNIVASGGTTDANTKKIVSKVTWSFTPTRVNTVTLTTYLTNWAAAVTNP
jgi:autotransporter-associated beta strand protein